MLNLANLMALLALSPRTCRARWRLHHFEVTPRCLAPAQTSLCHPWTSLVLPDAHAPTNLTCLPQILVALDENSALRVELDEQDLRCRGAALNWRQACGVVIVRPLSANVDHISSSPPSDAKTLPAVGLLMVCEVRRTLFWCCVSDFDLERLGGG